MKDDKQQMLRDHAAKLMWHFDSVQIVATVRTEDGSGSTQKFECGKGDYWARYGALKLHVMELEEDARLDARASREKDEE